MAENLQPTQVIAKLFGVSTRRVEQLKTEGVIKGEGKPTKYDLLPTIQAYIKYLSDKANGREKKETMALAADFMNRKYGEGTVTLTIKDSYQNMADQIRPHWHLVDNAMEAMRRTGVEPVAVPIRGGTDGARLSFMGLPCPNLGTGGFNFHGTGECITAERMDKATEILLNVVEIYSK